MSGTRPGYWFRPIRYGFGAEPANGAGWAATAVYLLLLGGTMKAMHSDLSRMILGTSMTIAFIAIVWVKTDGGWRWRWGGDE